MINKEKTESQNTKSQNFKNAVCYIPFGAFVLFFAENKKTEALNKNIKYGTILFGMYIVLNFILNLILGGFMSGILFMIYIGISVFLGFKAYNGEKIELDYIDEMEKKVKEKL